MTSIQMCSPCSRGDESCTATKFCVDCEDTLCNQCVETHKRIKTTMKHRITDVEAVTIVSNSTIAELKACPKHPEITIDLFCVGHEVLCCRRCMTGEHRSCENIVPLEDASLNVKKSSLLYDTSEDLKNFIETLNEFKKDRKQNKEIIKAGKIKIQARIKKFQRSLVMQLDEMMKLSLKELDDVCGSTTDEAEQEEKKAELAEQVITTYLQQTEFLNEKGPNQLLFTFLNYLQPKIKSEHNTLEDVISKASVVGITFDQNENILQGINKIGLIKVQKAPCNVKTIATKDTAAQGISLVPPKEIKSFKRDYDFDGSFECVTAIDVDKDNNVLLADKSYLKMYSQQGKYIKQCKLDGTSWDLSYHRKSGRIVVALTGKEIQFIDDFIPQSKITVPCLNYCRGITFINDNIAVGGKGNISILDFNGKHIRTITTEITRLIYYLHHHQSKLYFTDVTCKVYSITEDGTKLPTMTVSEIGGAEAVTTDHSGNMYVVGYRTDNVVCLSQDGKNSEVILKNEDGITEPYALCFSRDYNTLFVSFRHGKLVKAFKCEY